MPSANKTKNLGLNQWLGNEYPKRLDFVDDNEKIDEAYGNINKGMDDLNKELSFSENTKYTTANGAKEFECKDGYIDNVLIEGKTLVNMIDKTIPKSAGTPVTSINGSFIYDKPTSRKITVKNMSSKIVRVQFSFLDDSYSHAVTIEPSTQTVYAIDEGKKLRDYVGSVADGWQDTEQSKKELMNSIVVIDGEVSNGVINSYFSGLYSAGQGDKIEVLTCTQSPINIGNIVVGSMDTNNGAESVDANYKRNDKFVPCDTVEYTINTCGNKGQIVVMLYDENKSYISFTHRENADYVTFTPPANARFLRFRFKLTYSVINAFLYKGNSQNISYDKKQILTTLRSTPKVANKDVVYKNGDRYFKLQRCTEIVIDGSEGDRWGDFFKNSYNIECNAIGLKLDNVNENSNNLYCDKFKNVSTSDKYDRKSCYLYPGDNGYRVYFQLPSSEFPDKNSFINHIKTNPITVVVPLTNPIITELPNFNPRTFTDKTTFLLNSGVMQCEANFEVTNNLREEIDAVKEKVSSLYEEGQRHKITQDNGSAFKKDVGFDVFSMRELGSVRVYGTGFVNGAESGWGIFEGEKFGESYKIEATYLYSGKKGKKYMIICDNGVWSEWRSL